MSSFLLRRKELVLAEEMPCGSGRITTTESLSITAEVKGQKNAGN